MGNFQGDCAIRDSDETQVLYSEAWWETRTSGQLRLLIQCGLAAGEAFDGAVKEMNRRAREADRRDREAVEADTKRRGSIALWAVIASLLLVIAALAKGVD